MAVAGAVLVIGLVVQQVSRFGGPDVPREWEVEADLVLSGFRLEQVGEEGRTLQLQARRAKLVELNRRLLAEGLDVAFYEHGSEAVRLTAATGEVALDTERVTVRGNAAPATLALASGITVRAPELTWEPDSRTVHSTGEAAIDGASFRARGREARARVDEQVLELEGSVSVTWSGGEGD